MSADCPPLQYWEPKPQTLGQLYIPLFSPVSTVQAPNGWMSPTDRCLDFMAFWPENGKHAN